MERLTDNSTAEKKGRCCLTQLGHCHPGCNMMELAVNAIRWRGESPLEAANRIGAEHCPTGCKPQIKKGRNNQASSGFGQREEENWDDLQDLK